MRAAICRLIKSTMQLIVCLPYQLMRCAVGVVVVLAQLQNHCRSRETCSFGTPDAVLAAVGESVGIAERAGAASLFLVLLLLPALAFNDQRPVVCGNEQVCRIPDAKNNWRGLS